MTERKKLTREHHMRPVTPHCARCGATQFLERMWDQFLCWVCLGWDTGSEKKKEA
jgi:hypothetical protein